MAGEIEAIKGYVEQLEKANAALRAELTEKTAESEGRRRELEAVRAGPDFVWRWQGDGKDHPESIACPVVMTTRTLRSFVSAKEALEAIRRVLAEEGGGVAPSTGAAFHSPYQRVRCDECDAEHTVIIEPRGETTRHCRYHAAVAILLDLSGDDARRAMGDAGHLAVRASEVLGESAVVSAIGKWLDGRAQDARREADREDAAAPFSYRKTSELWRTHADKLETIIEDLGAGKWRPAAIEADRAERSTLARLRAALGGETAWPVTRVLAHLAEAADHMLGAHLCDSHGIRLVAEARDEARKIAAAVAGPLKTTTDPDGWIDGAYCSECRGVRWLGHRGACSHLRPAPRNAQDDFDLACNVLRSLRVQVKSGSRIALSGHFVLVADEKGSLRLDTNGWSSWVDGAPAVEDRSREVTVLLGTPCGRS